MAVYHGKNLSAAFGVALSEAAVDDVQSFTVNQTTNPAPYVSSSTAGSTSRVAGATDATGSITTLGSTVPSGLEAGATGNLILIAANGDEVWNGAVLIGDTTFGANTQGLPTATVNWGKT